MTGSFDVEVELADFNLDNMHPSGKANLVKVAEFMGTLDEESWLDYIENGSIDLVAVSRELEIARSSLYQNKHIKRYVLGKAEQLHQRKIILELPYQVRDKSGTSNDPQTSRYTSTDKKIKEKNLEIRNLQLKVAELTATVDGLKAELKDAKITLNRADIRENHLAQFGRYPR
ncbi:MAG: alpha/bet hydroase [Idiomarinaceae bacterium HL-53]|nr:MAG: alpha/bet hydroase [Idiomarinaceae bacterium HL-53]CUS47489.1 hypothetical protein Ga0003345_0416 [Idiomarinaceae bacterium HL-53]